jgi:hypothetical protein
MSNLSIVFKLSGAPGARAGTASVVVYRRAASNAENARTSLMTILPRDFDTGIMRACRAGFNGAQREAAGGRRSGGGQNQRSLM